MIEIQESKENLSSAENKPKKGIQSSYSFEDLLACGRGELFETPYPKLPMPPMLMFDRFTKVNKDGGAYGKGELVAELDIHKDLWFFNCHFIKDPVMPGCLGLDAVWQMLGFYLGWLGHSGKGRALGCGEVKFTDQVLPTSEIVEYKIHLKRVIARKLVLGIADGEVLAKGQKIYQFTDLKVGLFNE